jgi:hypothetical protein
MKHIVIVLNGKGGVGKSFFAVQFVQYLKAKGVSHVAIDTDNENSTLTRYHPEARFIDMEDTRQLDALFSATASADVVVVDGRAASTDLFLKYFKEIGLTEVLAQCETSLTLVVPINHEADSVDQLQRLVEELGSAARFVVIRNAAHSEKFSIYDNSEIRVHLRDTMGAQEMDMPRLQDWLVEALNRENLTVGTGSRHAAFSLLDRQRLVNWQRRFQAAVDSWVDLVLPTPPASGNNVASVQVKGGNRA